MVRVESDELAETTQFFHDLRQCVAAGRLLSEPAEDVAEGLHERLKTLQAVFEEIECLIGQAVDDRVQSARVDLVWIVEECVRIARLASAVPIETQYADRARACGDPVMLRRAVANVLDNAARAAGAGGRVRVVVREHAEESCVEVADDGAGFARISSVSGQGMSVVDAAVRGAGGWLEIASGPGPGTTVRLRLPAPREGSGHEARPGR